MIDFPNLQASRSNQHKSCTRYTCGTHIRTFPIGLPSGAYPGSTIALYDISKHTLNGNSCHKGDQGVQLRDVFAGIFTPLLLNTDTIDLTLGFRQGLRTSMIVSDHDLADFGIDRKHTKQIVVQQ